MGFFDKPEIIGTGNSSDADRARIAALETRVGDLEAQLAQLAQLAEIVRSSASGTPGTVPAEGWLAEAQELKRSGKLINAIKLYREHTGVGLKEAKDAVEAMPG
jgi:large subunit ribosomal protein L7/L12